MTGWGLCEVRDTQVEAMAFLTLRYDYGAFWNGDIRIINCRFKTDNDKYTYNLINAYNYSIHDFGYPCMGPKTIYIDGLEADGAIYLLNDYNSKCYEEGNTYIPTEKISYTHIYAKEIIPCENPSHYPDLIIEDLDKYHNQFVDMLR